MLDEQHMEKKIQARGSAVPASETKNKQDGPGGNAKFARSARRRDAQTPKQDPATKLQLQPRQKGNCDRRFQPRGSFVSIHDRHRTQVASENETEIGSADRPGSKKHNYNHLLNFTYERPDGARSASGHSWGSNENPNRAIWTTRKHKYNKEQFLQANCQFVVKGGRDYSVHSSDPDLLVDWEWIEQVHVNSHEVPSCPICLYPPVAAKMTRCGHIYCWPCILHYLALSDKTWRKCPICYEAVHKTDLKSIVTAETPCFNVGEKISMQLMRREKGSMVVMPKARWRETAGLPFHLDEGVDQCYAKLLQADRRQVLDNVIGREEAELDQALREYAECPEICFIESAIEQLKERKTVLLATGDQLEQGLTTDKDVERDIVLKSDAEEPVENDLASSSGEATDSAEGVVGGSPKAEDDALASAGEESLASLHDADHNCDGGGVLSKTEPGSQVYHFYQACDGQHVYMHAVNVHMLIREFGSLDRCPDVITAVIVEKEGLSMNEGLRKRLRYLGHLPLICEFEVVELRLEVPDVSQDTIDAFAEETRKRQQRRNRRAREEHKRERQFQADENRRLGKGPEARLRLNSLKHFPECSTRAPDDDAGPPVTPEGSQASLPSPVSQESMESPTAGSSYCGPSFAQMLQQGKMKPDARRQPSSASSTAATPRRNKNNAGSTDDEDDEEFLHAPSFRESFGAALQDALDRSVEAAALSGEQQSDGKKKKRGRQKRLLFSTSVTRSK